MNLLYIPVHMTFVLGQRNVTLKNLDVEEDL